MTSKAYIVANEEQELRVLNEFEKRGYCWINDQGKPISSGLLIARELGDYPLFISERFETKTIYWQDLSKLVNEEIVYDGRKEEHMSEKYVVSQVFMNELKEWKHDLILEDAFFVNQEAINNMPKIIKNWWVDDYETIGESNKRLISIIRYMSGANDFEVEKPKKWVVRSKDRTEQGSYLYIYIIDSNGVKDVMTGFTKDIATKFDTKEEADSWANSHQEVVQVEVEE